MILLSNFIDFAQQIHWFWSAISLILLYHHVEICAQKNCFTSQTKVVLLIQTNWFAIASATYLHETFVSQSIIPTSSSRSTIVYKQEKSPVLFHWAHDAAYLATSCKDKSKSRAIFLLFKNCYLLFVTLRNDVIDPWQCWDWLLVPCYALIETKPVLLTDWRAIQAFVWHFIIICDEKYKKKTCVLKKIRIFACGNQ